MLDPELLKREHDRLAEALRLLEQNLQHRRADAAAEVSCAGPKDAAAASFLQSIGEWE